ncbi:EAL domain-containing protein [Acidithiobacillus ferrooxidans]|uniref:bifunctional diguanylate cyclase/phosphodiesterase n=1 Tax=Acidithiobacillus ferrooxidans TaxID=920 RepID=UPI001C069227|nr:EAL domain-containing protein [Acidithiobacillus ferrooxidans]MBU2773199.1 EAL domain-containing protein [Acidithiobacillus ferrooxidans]
MSTTQHYLAAHRAFYQAIIQVERLHADSQADLPVAQMLEQVTCLIADILHAPMVWIGLVSPGQLVWSPTAAAGSAAAVFEGVHLSVDAAIPEENGPEKLIRSRQPYICDLDAHVMTPWRNLAMDNNIGGFAGAPFYYGQKERGIIFICHREDETFPEDILDLLSHLAECLGTFFNRCQTGLELARLRRYQNVYVALLQEMLRHPPPEILFQRLAQLLMEHADALGVVVWSVEPGSEWLRQVAVEARSADRVCALKSLKVSLNPEHVPYGRPMDVWLPHESIIPPLVVENMQMDREIPASLGLPQFSQGVAALGGWPITAGKGTVPVAVLMVESAESDYFSPALQSLLSQLVDSIHIALEEYHRRQLLTAEQESHAWQAHHDCLTGLPNRLGLTKRLNDAKARALRHGCLLGVAMLDLDDFKATNDRYGHAVGDRLLMALAARLKQALRRTDFVVRLGGDEFVLILEDLQDRNDLEAILNKIGEAIETPFELADDLTISIHGSLGLTIFPFDQGDADLLLQHADEALYAQKEAKLARNHFWGYYNESLNQHKRIRYQVLRALLGDGGLRVFYQPVLDLASHRIVGIEALARLENGEGAILLPKEFLPQFNPEDQHILTQLMLSRAITDLIELDKAGHALWVSVNVTPGLLFSGACLGCLTGLLASSKIDPSRIVLEILEGNDFPSMDEARREVLRIKALGVRLALDDIGSAYSSLLRFKDLPIDEIKLDQTFVCSLEANPNGLHFINALLDLSRSMGVDFVAEGCETPDILDALKVLRVPMVQGYAVAQAMPITTLRNWLQHFPTEGTKTPSSLLGIYASHLSTFSTIRNVAQKNLRWLGELSIVAEEPFLALNTAIAAQGWAGTAIDIAHRAYHRVISATLTALKEEGDVDWTATEDAADFFEQTILSAIREINHERPVT